MAKIDRYEQARREGMSYAYRVAKEKGLEELEKDLTMRNALKMPLTVSKDNTDDIINQISENCIDTVLCLFCYTMHNWCKTKFGNKRLIELINEFDVTSAYLSNGEITWTDIIEIMKEETNIEFVLPDECIANSVAQRNKTLEERGLL